VATLMCKNVPIYSTTTNTVLKPSLCPIRFTSVKEYNEWLKSRLYLKSNRIAEASVSTADNIDLKISKRRLSLSDCYWVKRTNDKYAEFEEITPYLHPFIDYSLNVGKSGSSVPDATIGGSFPKTWVNLEGGAAINKIIPDTMVYNEMAALSLAARLGVAACKARASVIDDAGTTRFVSTDDFKLSYKVTGNSIYIDNISDLTWMLLPLNWTTPSDLKINRGHDIAEMINSYDGILMSSTAERVIIKTLLFDAIVSNDDRRTNMSNWGYYKHSATGATRPAPLYDFNLAHVNQNTMYVNSVIDSFNSKDVYKKTAKEYLDKWESGIKAFGAEKWFENYKRLTEGIKY